MASADFSRQALLRDSECFIVTFTSVRPPRVLTRSFPSCPHHLYYAGFRAVIGLRLVWQPYPPALAYKWFLCVGAKVCLHLPSALLNLAARTLVFSYILPTAGWIRDLHSLERAPAGRTRITVTHPNASRLFYRYYCSVVVKVLDTIFQEPSSIIRRWK